MGGLRFNRRRPNAVVAQMAERLVANEKAVGPNPSYCTTFRVGPHSSDWCGLLSRRRKPIGGASPFRPTILHVDSAGTRCACKAPLNRFDSYNVLHLGDVMIIVACRTCNAVATERNRPSPPLCGSSSVAERDSSKVDVVGPIPTYRSISSKRGRAAIAMRCKRIALRGYVGSSPTAWTIFETQNKLRKRG